MLRHMHPRRIAMLAAYLEGREYGLLYGWPGKCGAGAPSPCRYHVGSAAEDRSLAEAWWRGVRHAAWEMRAASRVEAA